MEGWENPLDGRHIDTIMTEVGGRQDQVAVDRKSRAFIRDRFGRLVIGEAACGGLRVYTRDGQEVVSGWVREGDLRVNMYTGESYLDGKRVRRADRGPRAGLPVGIASDRHSNRRHP